MFQRDANGRSCAKTQASRRRQRNKKSMKAAQLLIS
jgi:hypothetical protein